MPFDRDLNHLLQDKRVCITTGARGIGKAIAILFARQGGVICLGGRNKELLDETIDDLQKISPASRAYTVNLSDGKETERFCKTILEDFGGVDVLVNVVGINRHVVTHEISDEMMAEFYETNYMSAFRCERAFIPGMIKMGGGSIVNISSIHSIMSMPGYYAYAGTKGAINASARAAALDYADKKIRINTVCPGLIMSDVVWDEVNAILPGKQRDNVIKLLEKMQPLQPGSMEDVAYAALFFATELSSYITGQTLLVDGGASVKAHP
jgi:NAD(P)-dependent dehydrogenase (short-subunit alcohol dehydrogenase family)